MGWWRLLSIGSVVPITCVAALGVACSRAPVVVHAAEAPAVPPLASTELPVPSIMPMRCGMGRSPADPLVAAHGCDTPAAFSVVATTHGAIAFGTRYRGGELQIIAETLDREGHTILAPRVLPDTMASLSGMDAAASGDDVWLAFAWVHTMTAPLVRVDALSIPEDGVDLARVVVATGRGPRGVRVVALADGRAVVVAADDPCTGRKTPPAACERGFDVYLASRSGNVRTIGRLDLRDEDPKIDAVVDLGDAVAVEVRGDSASASGVFRYKPSARPGRTIAQCSTRPRVEAVDGALVTYCPSDATLTTSQVTGTTSVHVVDAHQRCVDGRPVVAIEHDGGPTILPLPGAWTGSVLLDAVGFDIRARGCEGDAVVELP